MSDALLKDIETAAGRYDWLDAFIKGEHLDMDEARVHAARLNAAAVLRYLAIDPHGVSQAELIAIADRLDPREPSS